MISVKQVLEMVNGIAPFELAESWDNVGLLAGHPDWPVERVMVALDLTPGALEEAVRERAQMIVTHHPILFHGRKNLREDDAEGMLLTTLIRARIALVAAHTNYDFVPGGLNDALAETLGLTEVVELANGLRMGSYEGDPASLAEHARQRLGGVSRVYSAGRPIRSLAVCGGAGGAFWGEALRAGCDAYLTGEVHHHEALEAVASGLTVVESGHYHTERVMVKALQKGLQTRANTLKYNVHVFGSSFEPF